MVEIPSSTGKVFAKLAESKPLRYVHDKVLNVAHWAAGVNTVHPSTHRLLNATFLSAGLFTGRTMMNLFVGETPSGEKINKEDVPLPLRPLHGILAYDHFSDKPEDRWMRVMDMWFPAALGAVGAMSGSHVFALDQALVQNANKTLKGPAGKLTIDAAEEASIVLQSLPWRILSGITSLFGSASGFQLLPGPHNFGTDLSLSFIGTVGRNKLFTPYAKWLQKFISGNKHDFAYGPTSMLGKLREYLVTNHSENLGNANKMAYAIIEPWFGEHATPEKVESFVKELHAIRDRFVSEGHVPEKLQEECRQELLKVMKGLGLEKTFEKIGLDPAEATIGHNGAVEYFARLLGYNKTLKRVSEGYKNAYLERAGRAQEIVAAAPHDDGNLATIIGGSLLGAAGVATVAGAVNAQHYHKQDNEALMQRALGKTRPDSEEAKIYASQKAELEAQKKELDTLTFAERVANEKRRHGEDKSNILIKTINDKPLGLLEWGADALNSPETHGMHRVFCAGGLSLGGLIGYKFMDIVVGRHLNGQAMDPSKVPGFMMKFYNKLPYNPHSDLARDRWGFVAHFMVPAVAATAGVIAASSYFFKDNAKKAAKAEYLDDYENKATMDQAGPWTGLTALTSLFVTPSGFPFLPGVNYGTALGTRFNLSSNRKVILPIMGDFWTATKSKYPLGPSKLRDMMIKYAVNSKDAHPEQLEEMAIGILKPWFENISKDQVEDFIRKVEKDRNEFLKCGGIPDELKRKAEQQLIKHFKGAGLEETLRDIGLDPATAHLGNNGFSGRIAEWLGASDALEKTNKEFHEKYAKRLEELDAPPQTIKPFKEPSEKYSDKIKDEMAKKAMETSASMSA